MSDLIGEVSDIVIERGSASQKRQFHAAVAGLENRLNRFAPSAKAMAASRQALASVQDCDSLVERASAMFGAGFAHMHAGEHAAAADMMTQSLGLSQRCGDRTQQARCLAYLTIVNRKAGRATHPDILSNGWH